MTCQKPLSSRIFEKGKTLFSAVFRNEGKSPLSSRSSAMKEKAPFSAGVPQ